MSRRTFGKLRRMLVRGETTATAELIRSTKEVERLNPTLRAVTHLAPNAQEAASFVDNTLGASASPVAGVPILIKDCINVEGMETFNGYDVSESNGPAAEDADVVAALRKAGAVVFGKSNVPAGTMDVQTFNDKFGVTVNPYDVENQTTAGGSSGGSSSALAAGICDLAVGTDLAGSVRIPASFCGVWSLRPTCGVLSLDGVLPDVHIPDFVRESSFTVGPMGTDVAALRAFMDVVAPSQDTPPSSDTEFTSVALMSNFASVATDSRIPAHLEDQVGPHVEEQTDAMVAPLLDPFSPQLLREINGAHACLSSTWMPGVRRPLDAHVAEAMEVRNEVRAIIDGILDKHDVWVLPVCAVQPFAHNPSHLHVDVNGEQLSYWRALLPYVLPLTLTGHPVVTMPTGMLDGLPVGVQVVGKRGTDAQLLRHAARMAFPPNPVPRISPA